jgi:hypothetical protein
LAIAWATFPLVTHAATQTAAQSAGVAVDTVWVILAGMLVLFMQAGFAMLEVGFSRMKNVGTVVAKISSTSRSARSCGGASALPSPSAPGAVSSVI